MTDSNENDQTETSHRSSESALIGLVSWVRRLRCRYDFWRLSAADQVVFRAIGIDPSSKIKRGEI